MYVSGYVDKTTASLPRWYDGFTFQSRHFGELQTVNYASLGQFVSRRMRKKTVPVALRNTPND